MASVPISTSRQTVIDRIAEVMQAQYAAELSAIQDIGLYLPAPEAKDYYSVPQNPDQVIANHNVAVFIYPSGPRTVQSRASGGMGVGEMQRRTVPIDVSVICRRGMHDPNKPIMWHGKALGSDEILRRRAERYTGALINTILKYSACGNAGIVKVDLIDDMPEIFFDEESDKPMWGIGSAQFEFTQKVSVPGCRPLP